MAPLDARAEGPQPVCRTIVRPNQIPKRPGLWAEKTRIGFVMIQSTHGTESLPNSTQASCFRDGCKSYTTSGLRAAPGRGPTGGPPTSGVLSVSPRRPRAAARATSKRTSHKGGLARSQDLRRSRGAARCSMCGPNSMVERVWRSPAGSDLHVRTSGRRRLEL